MRETGLEKGGICNHSASKEELAYAAFDYAAGIVRERFESALEGQRAMTSWRRLIGSITKEGVRTGELYAHATTACMISCGGSDGCSAGEDGR